ncbi:MAG: hypothetical protein ACYDB7_06430 [Mycobacteriales bacterium]
MTVADLRCDRCGRGLGLPPGMAGAAHQASVRFSYHPGDPHLRDNSGLACAACWAELARSWLAEPTPARCAACSATLTRFTSLHVKSSAGEGTRQLCRAHAMEFLNALSTVEPKLDPQTFRFPPPPDPGG